MTTTDIPRGFEPRSRRVPSPILGPLAETNEQTVIIGLAGKPHTNGRGLIHGRLIATCRRCDGP
jgi:hypothetical protein